MQTFDIRIENLKGVSHYSINPVDRDNSIVYEVWDEDNHLFTLECCNEVHIEFALAEQYLGKGIDPEVVREVSEKIQSRIE